MLQVYTLNKEMLANSIVPFDNVSLDKTCNEELVGAGTINLNRCGVYEVHVDGVASASTTLQLTRNGVPMPEAQSTGTTLGFTTFVQVPGNNCQCNPCSSPVTIQVSNSEAVTLQNVNVTVKKVS